MNTAPQFQKTPVVGLTGGIGSGKTFVSNRLAELGAVVIDADEVAHRLTGPNGAAVPAVVAEFGPQAMLADGSMNRDHIRKVVFEQSAMRDKLESILHPAIRRAMLAEVQHKPTTAYHVLVVPLLFEKKGWNDLMDAVVVVDCPVETQEKRVVDRNGWPIEQIRAVIASQASRETRLAGADFVLDNSRDSGFLIQQVNELDKKLRKISAK